MNSLHLYRYLRSILAASLLLFIILAGAPQANGEQDETILVDSIPRVAVMWVGNEIIHPSRQPAVIQASEVEVRAEEVVYTSPGERYVFWSWSDGVMDNPRKISAGQDAVAIYKRQVRVDVIKGNGSGWYFVGETVRIWVEKTILHVDEGERMVFKGWAGGVVSPSPEVYINVVSPLVVEALWERQYKLETLGDLGIIGGGWYKEGEQAIVYASTVVEVSEGERMRFSRFTPLSPNILSCISPECNIVSITMSRPAVVKAEYARECRLSIILPDQTLEQWHPCGAITTIKADSFIVVGESTRLRFKAWSINGVENRDLFATVKVDEPTIAVAEYVREYLVTVISPMGTRTIWVEAGEGIRLTPPRESTTYLLANFNFKGWRGYGDEKVLDIREVTEPIVVIAEYALEPDYITITTLLSAISAIIVVYTIVKTPYAHKLSRAFSRVGKPTASQYPQDEKDDKTSPKPEG
ncbi:MAG TPA: hypothetical protein EYH45_03095 [Candidatus Caldiarchaeum subterraneum]|uniref:Bacterial repeat domain-containing protein n=1 Tax=Caldiarchaeum subterraneum TaxID=311458 RepID=A0A832ZV67_CALS0|nr:hypothetical protein [Candidatus Caldarchaeum subterraneum]